jgi:hypothetical protein
MHVMIDIEAFGKQPGGDICQISAVSFEFGSISEPVEILENADRYLNLFPEQNGEQDHETIGWWQEPSQAEALKTIQNAPRLPVGECLNRLASFCKSYLGKHAMIWAKPPGYDLNALTDLYHAHGMPCPWHRRQEACLRTLVWLADHVPSKKFRVPDLSAKGLTMHNALHDCVAQAILAQSAQRALMLDVNERSR